MRKGFPEYSYYLYWGNVVLKILVPTKKSFKTLTDDQCQCRDQLTTEYTLKKSFTTSTFVLQKLTVCLIQLECCCSWGKSLQTWFECDKRTAFEDSVSVCLVCLIWNEINWMKHWFWELSTNAFDDMHPFSLDKNRSFYLYILFNRLFW